MTAPSRSRLGKWIPFNVEFPSRARKQAVSSDFASTSLVCGVPSGPETHLGAPGRWMPLSKRRERLWRRKHKRAKTSLRTPEGGAGFSRLLLGSEEHTSELQSLRH